MTSVLIATCETKIEVSNEVVLASTGKKEAVSNELFSWLAFKIV